MEDALTKTLYENLLIQFLFKDEEVRDRLVPYLNPLVFSNTINSHIIGHILSFMEKHTHFPRMNELKLFIKSGEDFDKLLEIMNYDSSEYDRDFILGELEEFYRKSLLLNCQIEMRENMSKPTNTLQDFPDRIRESLAFTFDTQLGLSLLDDEDKVYNSFNSNDKIFPTGISALDHILNGGLGEKTLNLIMAPVNLGKSLCLCGLSVNFLKQNKKVLYISLEMSEQKIMERILANLLDENINELKNISKEKFKAKLSKIKSALKSDFKVVQYGARTLNSNKIRSILKEYEIKKKFKPDILVVDYLGIMIPNNKTNDSNTNSIMKNVSEELRAVGVEYGFPVLSAIQTNRGGFNNMQLELTDVSQGISIQEASDLTLSLAQTDEMKAAGKYKMSVLKSRYGLNGFNFYIGVDYNHMKIYDVDESQDLSQVITPKNIIDDASVEVLKQTGSNVKQNRARLTGIE